MYTLELVNNNISKLTKKDKVSKALRLIEEHKLTHIPIIENGLILGCLSEECLMSANEDTIIEDLQKHIEKFFLSTEHLLLDTFKIFHTFDSNIIPIVDTQENYKGYIMMEDVVNYFSKFPFISELGALLIVEIPLAQYSIAEIGKIVESNNSKLFGAIIVKMDNVNVQVAVKFSSENLSSVGETFERFGYIVLHKFYNDNKEELLDDRYNQLMNYLNI